MTRIFPDGRVLIKVSAREYKRLRDELHGQWHTYRAPHGQVLDFAITLFNDPQLRFHLRMD